MTQELEKPPLQVLINLNDLGQNISIQGRIEVVSSTLFFKLEKEKLLISKNKSTVVAQNVPKDCLELRLKIKVIPIIEGVEMDEYTITSSHHLSQNDFEKFEFTS